MDKLVSPLQSTCVLGRKGLNNMIIVQELIHTMSLKKGNPGNMAIKIDLEKAYDRLEWHFICDILILYNLPMDTSNLIISCVSRSSIYILFNGGKNYSWAHFFLFGIWNFWLQRKKRLFQSTQPNLNLCKLWRCKYMNIGFAFLITDNALKCILVIYLCGRYLLITMFNLYN